MRRSLELAKSSWHVLKADRELLALPVMSGVVNLAIAAMAFGVIWATRTTGDTGGDEIGTAGIVIGALAGLLIAIVAVFFNGALVAGARERLTGGNPSVGSALATATSRIPVLVPWAIVAFTVGQILRALSERGGAFGRIASSLLSMAWGVLTFLTVPIVVVEGLGPFAALRRSGELFQRTWGENLSAQVGLGLAGFLAMLPGILVGALLIATQTTLLVVIGVATIVVWVLVVAVVLSALTAIFQTALYGYATTGELPPAYSASDFESAFEPRRDGGNRPGFGTTGGWG